MLVENHMLGELYATRCDGKDPKSPLKCWMKRCLRRWVPQTILSRF